MVNKVFLIGRLGHDPEIRFTQSGSAVCNFSLATSEKWQDKSGEKQERTEWHRIVVWGNQADACSKYLRKGSLAFVEGTIQTREWEDKDGAKRATVEIKASNVRFLDGKSQQADSSPGESYDPGMFG